VGQTIPHVPDFAEMPSSSNQSELVPLRPFLLNSNHKAAEPIRMRGKSVRQGPTGWILECGTIESGDRLLLADRIQYNPETNFLEAIGNIRFESLNFRMYCEQLKMDWDKKSGEATDLKFEMPDWILQSGRVKFDTLKKWKFDKVTVKPGIEENPGWQANASRLTVDLEHYAKFHNLWMWVYGFPTHWFLPYGKYPVQSQRVSGFLPISISRSIGIPYYKVLGHTADATVTPRFFNKNGILWDGEIRWNPDQAHSGSVVGTIIKQRTNNQWRYCFNINELWQREDGWRFAADLKQASDNLLDVDYDKGIVKLGENTRNGAIYLGKSFSWGHANVSVAQQKSYLPPYDIFFRSNFESSIQREVAPSIQLTVNPISIGSFYVDGDIRVDRLGYHLDLGPSCDLVSSGANYNLNRNDVFLRASKSFYLLGSCKTNLRFGGRLTHYSKTLQNPLYSLNAMAVPLVNAGSANRAIGSTRIDFFAPAVGRVFNGAKLSHQLKETKHIITPCLAFSSNTNSHINNYLPHFDGVDSQPGISGSAAGEQSLELSLKQHFLCRSKPNMLFLDLFRWNIAVKYNFCNILMPDGKQSKGWGSISNDFYLELSKKLRINFRRGTSIVSGSRDKAISADYSVDDKTQCSLVLFSNGNKDNRNKNNGNNQLLFRQKGIQVGGVYRLRDNTIRLESLCNYDFNQRYFASAQFAIACVQPCVSESLGFYHVSRKLVPSGALHRKEDRLVFTITLRNIGDFLKFQF
jgi:hypothetical protein